jgi:HK97 family phage major capsid protein
MATATLGTPPVSNGLDFRHVACGDSWIDKLFDNGGGFTNLAHFVRCASRVQANGQIAAPSESDQRLYRSWNEAASIYRGWLAAADYPSVKRAVSSPDGLYENSGPDGGDLIPPSFIQTVWDKARFRDTPLSRVRTATVATNVGQLPALAETSRVDGSRWGGLLALWLNEAQQLTKTFPTLATDLFRLKKVGIFVPVTGELMEDAGLLDPFLDETVSKEFAYQLNEKMINGLGAGELLGVVKAPGTITVPKDSGQTAGTISFTNLSAMWTQSHGPSRANMVWYAQEDIDPDTLPGTPVSLATGWTGPQPSPTFKGRPFLPLENCGAIGAPGDCVLGDWSQYLLILGGMRKTVSVHFRFDFFESTLRFILRADGMPLWPTPLVPPHSTIPKSPFLVIAQR